MCELKYNPEKVIDNNPKSWRYATIKKCEDIPNLISTIINEDYGDFFLIPEDNEDKKKLSPIHDYLRAYETINYILRNETKSDEFSEAQNLLIKFRNLYQSILCRNQLFYIGVVRIKYINT